jgi:hypothetical protein
MGSTMYSSLQARCELELERYVAKVHESKFDDVRQVSLKTPWMWYSAFSKAGLIAQIRAPLDARIWFDKHGPGWAQPLPLGEEYFPLLEGDGPLYLLGLYAFSLEVNSYEFWEHPQIYDFARGAMASLHCKVRDDRELQREFPPKTLPGLGPRLCWFAPRDEKPSEKGFSPR